MCFRVFLEERMAVFYYVSLPSWSYSRSKWFQSSQQVSSPHIVLFPFGFLKCTCYDDDFPTICISDIASLTSRCMSLLLNLLGWDHAQVGAKALDFDSEFTALGASLNLSGLAQGKFVLGNKPGRVDKIVAMVKSVQAAGKITRAQAAEIQGHLNFASGFYMSRSLKFVLNRFDEAARQVDIWRSHLCELCELTMILMTSMPPREFTAEAMRAPHLVFTDGAWEQGEATAGLFVYDAEQNQIFTQAILVPDIIIDIWKQEVGEQLMPNWAFCFLGSEVLLCCQQRNCYVPLFGRHDKSSSSTWRYQTFPHLDRTSCSFSNPADDPSRGRGAQSAQAFGGTFVEQPLEVAQEVVDAIVKLTETPYASVFWVTWEPLPKQGVIYKAANQSSRFLYSSWVLHKLSKKNFLATCGCSQTGTCDLSPARHSSGKGQKGVSLG